MKDALGDRMKGYEATTKTKLLRRGYTMIRIDGKAFHSYTKGLQRPFDKELVDDMDLTAQYLCQNIQNAVCAFVQSDEISILMCDFEKQETDPWFKNDVQKIVSVAASMATAFFNYTRLVTYWAGDWKWDENIKTGFGVKEHFDPDYHFDVDEHRIAMSDIINYFPMGKWKLPMFDARVFQLPTKTETENYFIWRQQDTVKNSITAVANTKFSHKELQGKNGAQKQEMMFQKDGTNWNDFDPKYKRGRMIVKERYEKEPDVFRTRWVSVAPPTFTQDREYLDGLIPNRDEREKPIINWIPKDLSIEDVKSLVENLKNQIKHYSNLLNKE